MTAPARVLIASCSAYGITALVDGATVRVKVLRPAHGRPRLPRWTCSACPEATGRTSCEHIDALAETHPTPGQLERIRNPRPRGSR